MIICFYAVHGLGRPEETTCEVMSYPHIDGHGRTIFANTHFHRLEDAWAKILREHEADVSLCNTRREQARATMVEATEQLAEAARQLVQVRDSYEEWRSAKDQGE